MKLKALFAVAASCLALAACERQERANVGFSDFVSREYGARGVISAAISGESLCTNSSDSVFESAYRVNVFKDGKTYSGFACHRTGGPDWRIWFDAATVLPLVTVPK